MWQSSNILERCDNNIKNCVPEEIMSRLNSGNVRYRAVQNLLSPRLLSIIKSKVKIWCAKP
jgi:hypothetical protein